MGPPPIRPRNGPPDTSRYSVEAVERYTRG
jgi:hypothetical protein